MTGQQPITHQALVDAGADLHDRFGRATAAAFGAGLPAALDQLAATWNLQIHRIMTGGANAVVLDVTANAGVRAVLKISPDLEAMVTQVAALRHLGPTGRVPAVLNDDKDRGAVLLERVHPGTPCDALAMPPDAAEWAELVNALHATPTTGIPGTLAERCDDMFVRIGARQALPRVRRHVSDRRWQAAVSTCRDLVSDQGENAAIHGDLHFGNALLAHSPSDQRRRLVAVDPKLCIGDRCFDLVDYVVDAGDAGQMTQRCAEIADLTGVDHDRLLAWSRVNAVAVAVSRITWDGFVARNEELVRFGSGCAG